MSPRLAFALDAATKGGRLTLAHFQTGAAVETKADDTPVTIADKGAERLIRELIAKRYPGDEIFGEEEGGNSSAPNRWIIDPIDGTKSFISGVPLYSTLVSYEENFVPIIGVAYFPALGELLYAEKGGGTFHNGIPSRVSSRSDLKSSVLCCGGLRSMINAKRWDAFATLSQTALATRTWSDAYGHMLVATGRVEAMIDPLVSRWDLSALDLILAEAGGRMSRFDGTKTLVGDKNLEAISSNGILHEMLIRAFAA